MDDDPPPHSVIDLLFGDASLFLTLMCNNVRFHITVCAADLSPSKRAVDDDLGKQFIEICQNVDEDPDILFDWVILPCISFIKSTARPQSRCALVLEEYYAPKTYFLRLHNVAGTLSAQSYAGDRDVTRYLEPRIEASDLSMDRGLLEGITLVDATELYINGGSNVSDSMFSSVPRAVSSEKFMDRLFFKAATDPVSFNRELNAYLTLGTGNLCKDCRLPKLLALVAWSDRSSFMGFLIEYIAHEGNLRECARSSSPAERKKWMRQLEASVKNLHNVGLTWGDVKPDNVLIDDKGDARVIDFGGGYSEDWVDPSISETEDGDWQGISRIRAFLGLT